MKNARIFFGRFQTHGPQTEELPSEEFVTELPVSGVEPDKIGPDCQLIGY